MCFSTSLCPAAAGLSESRERSANSDCSWREKVCMCVCERCSGVKCLVDIVLPKIPWVYLSVFASLLVCACLGLGLFLCVSICSESLFSLPETRV